MFQGEEGNIFILMIYRTTLYYAKTYVQSLYHPRSALESTGRKRTCQRYVHDSYPIQISTYLDTRSSSSADSAAETAALAAAHAAETVALAAALAAETVALAATPYACKRLGSTREAAALAAETAALAAESAALAMNSSNWN